MEANKESLKAYREDGIKRVEAIIADLKKLGADEAVLSGWYRQLEEIKDKLAKGE